jgi:hypothetical protein
MKEHIIVDLDGTIALDTGRAQECLHSGKRDWDAYYARCHEDAPNHNLITLLQVLEGIYHIWIISGRREDTREVTMQWLAEHGVPFTGLTLRPVGNFVDDHILKLQMAEEMSLSPHNVLVVFEDRDRVVKAWRSVGYSCFQVASGDF